MKYFTPDLYMRLNASDERVAERAHDQWEEAIDEYKRHLQDISTLLKPRTRQLAESLCLHDASYLGLTLPQLPTADNSLAILATRHESKFAILVYVLAEEPLIREVNEHQQRPFSKESVCWLYDEFDVDQNGVQQHEVFLSNGRVITLRFYEIQLLEHSATVPSQVA